MSMFTFTDAFDSLIFYLGGAPSEANRRDCYQAIDEALRDIVNAHTWSYLYKQGRINTRAPFTDGTIGIELASDAKRLGQDLVGTLVDRALREAERNRLV